jgi:hypothetical protein
LSDLQCLPRPVSHSSTITACVRHNVHPSEDIRLSPPVTDLFVDRERL